VFKTAALEMIEKAALMGGDLRVFRPFIHAFPEEPLMDLLGDPMDVGKVGVKGLLVDNAVRDMPQLQPGRFSILDGDPEKPAGPVVF
jgi:hypothetical protein